MTLQQTEQGQGDPPTELAGTLEGCRGNWHPFFFSSRLGKIEKDGHTVEE